MKSSVKLTAFFLFLQTVLYDCSASKTNDHVKRSCPDADSLSDRLSAVENELGTLKNMVNRSSTAVAFTVRFQNDDPHNGLPVGNKATLRFDDVVSNFGQGYNKHTGIFTAPVAGYYSFFLNVMARDGGVQLSIVQDGRVLDEVWGNSGNDQGAGQVVAHLDQGAQVWVRHSQGSTLRGGYYTLFTGFLLQAD